MLIDAGNGSYTSKTFSDERYEIWNTQSSYHNVPTINGVAQSHGEEFAAADVAYEVSPRRAVFTLDLAGAYPAEARVRRWRRQITLERGQEIRIEEEFELEEVLAPQQLHFLTLCHVDASEAGRCVLTTRGLEPVVVTVIYDPHVLEPRVEPVPLDEEQDRAVRRAWGEHLLRLTFVVESREASGAISLRVVPGA